MKLICFSLQMVLLACISGIIFPTRQGFASSLNDRGVYCGDRLMRTLRLVCGSVYNKRYDSDSFDLSNSLQSSNTLPYLNRNSPISLLVKRALALRSIRGIADECCARSCDYSVLLTYCGPLRTTEQPNRISSSQAMARDLQDLQYS